MRIFHNRPLALLCFIFIAVSLLTSNGGWNADIIAALILCFAAIAVLITIFFLILFNRIDGNRFVRIVFLFLAIMSALAAPISQFIFEDVSKASALESVGEERRVSFVVVDEEFEGDYSSEYHVKTVSVDGKEKEVRCIIVCAFSGAFEQV